MQQEIRVRPVIRHAVTRFTQDGRSAGSEMLGEFGNEAYAEEVAEALRKTHCPKQYAIVERSFDLDVQVYYAESRAEAEAHQKQLMEHFGKEFRIYEREVTDPIAAARISLGPTTFAPLTLPGNPVSQAE